MKSFAVLHTDRLTLRELISGDIDYIFEGLSHPDVIRYYGVQYDTREATQAQMHWFDQLMREETGIWWAICERSSTAFLGAAGFNNRDPEKQTAEIGFWLLPEHWGKGYIPEALDVIIEYGFNQLHLSRIEALIETENENSLAVVRKKGFQYERTMVNCEIKNEKPISLMVFSLSAPAHI